MRILRLILSAAIVPACRSFGAGRSLRFHPRSALRPPPSAFRPPPSVLCSALAVLLLLGQAQAADLLLPAGLTNSPLSDAPTSLAVLRDPKALAVLMAALDDTIKLGSGDKITYRVLEDQDPTRDLTVGDSGDLDVPYFGLVQAEKKTCKQLAIEIKRLLEKQNYRRATVILSLQEINRKRILGKVYVVGQVKQSGPLEIPDDEVFTVSKAILKAGGFSDFADKGHVKLVRGGAHGEDSKTAIIINVAEIWEKGKTSNDVPVQAGDVVFVPKKNINF
ncbi:MAG: polysaccharide biosynthesis/export family protein [Limisphaerales bacterium]